MKNIKNYNRFNESMVDKYQEINEFTDENLIYLTDEGFECIVNVEYYGITIRIEKTTERGVKDKTTYFNYDVIKDDFIPFIIRLSQKYNLKIDDGFIKFESMKRVSKPYYSDEYLTVSEISEDDVEDCKLDGILIIIREKYLE